MDAGTIIIETRLREPIANKAIQKIRTKTNNISDEQTDPLIQDDVGYPDDATLFIEKDTCEQMCDRMGNYDIVTETRELKIQWLNVLLVIHAGRGPKEELPPPFGQIKFTKGGTIIGRKYT